MAYDCFGRVPALRVRVVRFAAREAAFTATGLFLFLPRAGEVAVFVDPVRFVGRYDSSKEDASRDSARAAVVGVSTEFWVASERLADFGIELFIPLFNR